MTTTKDNTMKGFDEKEWIKLFDSFIMGASEADRIKFISKIRVKADVDLTKLKNTALELLSSRNVKRITKEQAIEMIICQTEQILLKKKFRPAESSIDLEEHENQMKILRLTLLEEHKKSLKDYTQATIANNMRAFQDMIHLQDAIKAIKEQDENWKCEIPTCQCKNSVSLVLSNLKSKLTALSQGQGGKPMTPEEINRKCDEVALKVTKILPSQEPSGDFIPKEKVREALKCQRIPSRDNSNKCGVCYHCRALKELGLIPIQGKSDSGVK